MSDTLIFMPSYRSAPFLRETVDRCMKSTPNADILIIDDESPDYTSQAAALLAQEHPNISVHTQKPNLGYGGSQKTGFGYACSHNYKYALLVHSDGQYPPENLSVMTYMLQQGAGMVFGSRMTGNPLAGGMPLIKYLGNRFLTLIENKAFNLQLSEWHSGFRGYRVDVLKQIPYNCLTDDFHFDTELILMIRDAGYTIQEFTIPTLYGEEISSVNIWRYGLNILKTIISYRLHQKNIIHDQKWTKL